LFATDGAGDLGCNIDTGIFLQINKPISGENIGSGIGKFKLGPSIAASDEGRGNSIQTGAEFFAGGAGLGVTVSSSTGSGISPNGIAIEGGVLAAFGADQTVNFSLSVGDLARLAAALRSGNFNQRIFGVDSGSQCGCNK